MTQRPLTVILNSSAGNDAKRALRETIRTVLAEAGHAPTLIDIAPHDDFPAVCERAVLEAKHAGGVVVAAGGDGTVNAVAALCCVHAVPMGVIPLGTFNYFARELAIPTALDGALAVLTGGAMRRVSVGYIHDRLFLNNASFGLYTQLIRERENATSRFGRLRIVAALSAMTSLFEQRRPFAIKFATDQREELRRTSMVFVGNNTLQLSNLGLDVARCTRQNKLAVVILRQTGRLQTARLLFRGIVRSLKDEALEEFCTDHFEVETRQRTLDVAIDGEIVHCPTPLAFRVEKDALEVLAPLPETPAP